MLRLSREQVEQSLNEMHGRIDPLERFAKLYARELAQPLLYDSAREHVGFRYGKPDKRHFCLLKLVRCVSALNAMSVLARAGFHQELCVLVRTIAECTTQIEFVLTSAEENGTLKPKAQELVDTFFADFARNTTSDFKRSKLRQGEVHAHVGASLDSFVENDERSKQYRDRTAEQLLSHVYLTYSNYVHCKYPETMDLYGGGQDKHFHMSGMSNTPKDFESLAILESFIDSVALSARSIVLHLKLSKLVSDDEALKRWFDTAL